MTNKINLHNVTLVSADTKQPHLAVKSLEKTCEHINFKRVILFSDVKPFNFNDNFFFAITINVVYPADHCKVRCPFHRILTEILKSQWFS